MAGDPVGDRNPSAHQIGQHSLQVSYQDLATVAAEALVSSDDSYLTMGGAVSAGLAGAGGRAVRDHARKLVPPLAAKPLRPGDVAVTTAGALVAKHLFHAVMVDHDSRHGPTQEAIRASTRRCMELAAILDIGVIAFPALGTGPRGLPFNAAADAMARTIVTCLDSAGSVRRVIICLLPGPGGTQLDLNTFYEASVGLIALWQQSKVLKTALDRLALEVREHDRVDDGARLTMLSKDLQEMELDLAGTPSTIHELEDETCITAVRTIAIEAIAASRRASDGARVSPALAERALEAQLEALRLQRNALLHLLRGLENERAYGTDSRESESRLVAVTGELDVLDCQAAETQDRLVTAGRETRLPWPVEWLTPE